MLRWTLAMVLAISFFGSGQVLGQGPPSAGPGRNWGGERGGDRIMGTVASVGVDRFTVKTPDGKKQVVLVDDQTRYREQQKEIQLEDLKTGDHVFIAGHMNADHQLAATMVGRATREQIQQFAAGGDRAFGEIVAIDKNQLRIRNRWQGERLVTVDESTTYMKEGKDSSLVDLKVGDRIMALGKQSDSGFTATRIMSGMMPGGGKRGGPGGGFPGGPGGGPPNQGPPPE